MLKPGQLVSWLGVFLLLLEQAVGENWLNSRAGHASKVPRQRDHVIRQKVFHIAVWLLHKDTEA